MTRAMLVQVLHRMSGSKAASTAQFTDVADGKWYAEAIAWASENGIVNGFTDGRFQPDTLITVSSWRPSCTATIPIAVIRRRAAQHSMATRRRGFCRVVGC